MKHKSKQCTVVPLKQQPQLIQVAVFYFQHDRVITKRVQAVLVRVIKYTIRNSGAKVRLQKKRDFFKKGFKKADINFVYLLQNKPATDHRWHVSNNQQMKRLFTYSLLFILAACEKGTDNNAAPSPVNQGGQNNSTVCFKTTFINTTINGGSVSVFFLNEKDGFVTSYTGGIYKTTDSAKTWTTLNSGTTLPIRDIYFIDNNKGFAVGGLHSCGGTGCVPPGGFILRTLDGGQNWTKIYTPANMIEISSIYFTNATTGFCAGDNMIFKTTDGGATWAATTLNNLGGLMLKISFADNQNAYITCTADKIVKTIDGGATWTVTSPNKGVVHYAASSAEGVTYVSGQGKILKTFNGGSNWTELIKLAQRYFQYPFH
jgi:photosystem II stability/assembly factor-like uncharacterized protein